MSILGAYDDAPGWPDRPRRGLQVNENRSHTLSTSIGHDFSFLI